MNYNGCTITIGRCQDRGWRDWLEYTVTNGQQSVSGRSRGTQREVVSLLKWEIDHNEKFPKLAGNLTPHALDGQYLCARCGHPESSHPTAKCAGFARQ